MAATAEGDGYHFYGTPIGDEEETRARQFRKEVKDPAATRGLPAWKQVRDVRACRGGCRRRIAM
jgi:hypothetical protein